MTRRATLYAALAAIVGAFVAPGAQAEDTLTVVSWGGAYQESQRKAYYEPFTAETGIKIIEAEWTGDIAALRAMSESGNVTWDVVDTGATEGIAGCDQGFLEEIDYGKLGQPRDKFVVGGAMDCAVATIVYATVFGYDNATVDASWGGQRPTTVEDFFDLEKFPGKRAMYKKPFVNMEWALIADGVPADQVYDVLGTEDGIARAFAKLDTLKANAVWWEAGAQAAELLANGEAVMSQAWNGRLYNPIKNEGKDWTIVWDRQAMDFDYWTVVKGTPKLDLAYQFLAYASAPENMARQSQFIAYGPSHADAIPNINPDVLKDLPTAPDNMKTAFTLNAQFWADNVEAMTERFNAWLAQ